MRLGYARVSTSSGEQLSALETQRARLDGAGVDRVISDVQSGLESDRAGLIELIDLITRGKVSELVITRVDRLGRNAADTDSLIVFCAKHGTKITALDGGEIESASPTGFAMSRFATTMAELESRIISQRIRSNLAQKRLQHLPLRAKVPWGYRLNHARTALEPDPQEWLRAKAFLRYLERTDWRLSGALELWERERKGDIPLHSARAVKTWLINPVLRGGLGYQRISSTGGYRQVVWGTHKALISQPQFDELSKRLEENRRMWGINLNRKPHLLSGLVRCAHCDAAMNYGGGKRKTSALICAERRCPHRYHCIREETIEQAIAAAIRERAYALADIVAVEDPEISTLHQQIIELESREDPDLEDAIRKKRERINEIAERSPVDTELLEALRTPAFLDRLNRDERRQLYAELVRRVWIRDLQVERVDLAF